MIYQALCNRFAQRKDNLRPKIEPYLEKEVVVNGKVWILTDFNDLGVLYWRKKGRRTLFTIASLLSIEDLRDRLTASQ